MVWLLLNSLKSTPNSYPSYFNSNANIFGKGLPKNLHFCNDTLPANDLSVKENIQKEFSESGIFHDKKSVQYLFAKVQRWFPYIEPIIEKNGLPDDVKFIAIIESHLSNITSPMGAKGFWQLLPETARNYGLEVNEYIDERLDVEKSTTAACKLIKSAYNELHNWPLAAAAYNYGINGIKSQIEKQNANSYYQLKLNNETKEFVYKIIVYKSVLTYPEFFGIRKKTAYQTTKKVALESITIDSTITDIKYLAQYLHCPTLLLKAFNPWLITNQLPNPEHKKYVFKIPINIKADYSGYIADLLYFNNIDDLKEKSDTIIKKDSTTLHIDKSISE